MAKVNPPPHIIIPQSILKNRDLTNILEQFNYNLFQLWVRTGKGVDQVGENETALYELDEFTRFIPQQDTVISTQSADYTTVTTETVICTNSITVTLNETPNDNELVKIKITNGDVTINATKLIDGQPSITFIADNLQGQPMIDIFYSAEQDTWYIV